MATTSTAATSRPATIRARVAGVVVTLLLVSALVGYKTHGALVRLRASAVPKPLAGDPAMATLAYLRAIWPALVFGVLIAAAVRVLLPSSVLSRLFVRGTVRAQIVAAATATPLMLCSCCAAPLFGAVYERTRRAGPALALMLGAPSLNLAALAFTVTLFGVRLGMARAAMALVTVTVGTAVVSRFAGEAPLSPGLAVPVADADEAPSLSAFLRSVGSVALRTVPLIVIGVLLSSALTTVLPPASLASGSRSIAAVLVVATIAVPLALPTFFELPLALALIGAGLPVGAAAALLFAGPAVNLPSLFTVARQSSWRLAVGVAAAVWVVAVAGGLTIEALA